ncbi:cytochrome c oxidase subunit II [Methylophilaceae bacterium]|nr:cytochrome c oxidase subunit II [Methylophilaceae bacterium]
MSDTPGKIFTASILISLLLFPGFAVAELAFNLPPPATVIAREIYDLHTLILLVCLFIFIVVFGFMFYALYKHRKSVGHKASRFSDNTRLEYAWTIIPMLILMGMAYPTTKTILSMKDTESHDMSIKVTGHQWRWEYDYMDENLRFTSNLATPRDQIENRAAKGAHYLLEVDNPMVVPIGKKVRLLLTATDVIHSWWIPEFGVKQDAIPGFINETWFQVDEPGFYRGQCAELCGVGHGFMPIVVQAMTEPEYEAWLTGQKSMLAAVAEAAGRTYTLEELKTHGEKVFNTNCAVCHQASGQGMAGVFPPLIDGAPFKASADSAARLSARGFWKDGKIVLGPVKKHLDIVMHGIAGSTMMPFGSQLSDLDIAAVITYERNSWGNQTGDIIQPAEVTSLRNPETQGDDNDNDRR